MSNQAATGVRVEPMPPLIAPAKSRSAASSQRARPASRPQGGASLDRLTHYVTRPLLHGAPIAFGVLVACALYVGWANRDEGHLTPESGTGYWLGIIGASMMLLLLVYPLRKRIRLLRYLGRVPAWFRLHMLLGILGPTLILFHCNFKLGSLNSNVALAAMLTVVGSGIVGRYLYARVHKGLYGSKTQVSEIIADAQSLKSLLDGDLGGAERLLNDLKEFEAQALAPRRGALLGFGWLARRYRAGALKQASTLMDQHAVRFGWTQREKRQRLRAARRELALYFAAVKKAARFALYERLLALWHVLHLPLFLLLIATAIVHVIAVHLY